MDFLQFDSEKIFYRIKENNAFERLSLIRTVDSFELNNGN